MDRLVISVALIVAAVAVASVLRHRQANCPDAPTQSSWTVPIQLDRADFARPDAAWLVAVFISATCDSCADVVAKTRALESHSVAVDELEVGRDRHLHNRYGIDAVPTVVIADEAGVVRASFVGPVTATDLWAAVAEAREPGSTPPDCDHGQP